MSSDRPVEGTEPRDAAFEQMVATILSGIIDESQDHCTEYKTRMEYESLAVSAAIRLARDIRRACAQ